MSHVTSVEGFTDREVQRATTARKFLHDLSAASVEDVKFFIRSNQARNVPISTEDIQLAEKVFGTNVPLCKGKWTAKKPPVVRREDHIELPPELQLDG